MNPFTKGGAAIIEAQIKSRTNPGTSSIDRDRARAHEINTKYGHNSKVLALKIAELEDALSSANEATAKATAICDNNALLERECERLQAENASLKRK